MYTSKGDEVEAVNVTFTHQVKHSKTNHHQHNKTSYEI